MPGLYVYLTDGFANDHVIVAVDGRKIFDEEGVTTKKLYGLAQEVGPVTVTGAIARLEIALPEKKLGATIEVDLSKGSHVPISLREGRFVHSIEKQIGFM